MAAASRDGDLQLAIGASSIFERNLLGQSAPYSCGNWNELERSTEDGSNGWMASIFNRMFWAELFFFSRLAAEWPLEPKLWLYTEFA